MTDINDEKEDMRYFIPYTLDCDDALESFSTLKEAVECAKEMLEYLTESACEGAGWHWDMDYFKIVDKSGAVYYKFKQIDVVKRPDDIDENNFSESFGDYWNPDGDYICGYELQEVMKR